MVGSSVRDETAQVVLADLMRRPPVRARVVVFANEKGGVGKSTLAFHCAVALARAGNRVLAIDLDRRQQSLARALDNRAATARSFGVNLPSPRCSLPEVHSAAMLLQEISRLGSNCNTIVIDLPGQDSPVARRAIALADVLFTPVNANLVDLTSLARVNPVSGKITEPGKFAELVCELRAARRVIGMPEMDWIMVRNRVRHSERFQLRRFDAAAGEIADRLGMRLCVGLSERVAYRELYTFGLTHHDCRSLPGLTGIKLVRTDELDALLAEARLLDSIPTAPDFSRKLVAGAARGSTKYREALQSYFERRQGSTHCTMSGTR